jgi:hypothetical protein
LTLLEDVLGEVVHWIEWANLPDLDHAFGEERDDILHEELSHVEVIAILELLHVSHDGD